MTENFFHVEDFIQSICVQLDRVQDALRMKSVNRPLTYALKDFSVDFHVFADVDTAGSVRFRTASANESGASTLRLGFTTITKPMIEENTVSLAATRSPTLDELGLKPDEVKRLEGLGVRTANQLHRLQTAAGSSTVSRLSGVSSLRLKETLQRAEPTVHHVNVVPPKPQVGVKPGLPRQVHLTGRNLLPHPEKPIARFGDRVVDIAKATDDELIVDLPADAAAAGTLEIAFSDDLVRSFDVRSGDDPWGVVGP
jgi:hypothetical protein